MFSTWIEGWRHWPLLRPNVQNTAVTAPLSAAVATKKTSLYLVFALSDFIIVIFIDLSGLCFQESMRGIQVQSSFFGGNHTRVTPNFKRKLLTVCMLELTKIIRTARPLCFAHCHCEALTCCARAARSDNDHAWLDAFLRRGYRADDVSVIIDLLDAADQSLFKVNNTQQYSSHCFFRINTISATTCVLVNNMMDNWSNKKIDAY